jgi:hypothetical protein
VIPRKAFTKPETNATFDDFSKVSFREWPDGEEEMEVPT